MTVRPTSTTKVQVLGHHGGRTGSRRDTVVTEEPMEIRLSVGGASRTVAVTMRTPGNDFELAAGFLCSEGIVTRPEQILTISYCRDAGLPDEQLYNIVIVELAGTELPAIDRLERHFQISSSCGVCGKANIEAVQMLGCEPIGGDLSVPASVLTELPGRLRESQVLFGTTGGLHASGLFDPAGQPAAVREDVGRHNAVDKLVGWALLGRLLPLAGSLLMVSGRSSFEIIQKAAMAGIPVVCSVSAPSSLAIEVAEAFGITLVGFLRDDRFNVYAGEDRIS